MKKEELIKIAKPVLFNTEMVRAIMNGTKSCTRRIIKPNSIIGLKPDKCRTGMPEELVQEKKLLFIPYCNMTDCELVQSAYKQKYEVGDILYVRETWQCWRAHRYEANADIRFRAGGEGVRLEFANGNTDSVDRFDYDNFVNKWFSHNGEWKPSLFMPKQAARIFLKVTGVRAERLQDITEKQAIKEGCQAGSFEYQGAVWGQEDFDEWTAVDAFKEVWNSTIDKKESDRYGWDANPWVWVYEFEVLNYE